MARSLLALPYTLILALVGFGYLRAHYGLIHSFDSGLYLQLLSNLARDGSWASSVTGEANFLGHHFQPIMALLVPFYSWWPKTALLFAASGVWVGISVFLLQRFYEKELSKLFLMLLLTSFCLHATITMRMIHGFVPEIFAVPGLLLLAHTLVKPPKYQPWKFLSFGLLLSLFIGLCKENLWLVLAWVFLLLSWRCRSLKKVSLALAVFNAAMFVVIFRWWMPAHSVLPSYYALRYYEHNGMPIQNTVELLQAMFLNTFSWASWETLFFSTVVLSGGLIFLASPWVLLGALPGILIIMASSRNTVHTTGNQYFLLVLPFLWTAVMAGLSDKSSSKKYIWGRRGCIAAVAINLLYTGQIIYDMARTGREQAAFLEHVPEDSEKIRAQLQRDHSYVLLDGVLQPLFPEVQQAFNILVFKGNPRPLRTEDFAAATDVITYVDVTQLPKDCVGIAGDSNADGGLGYDYEVFASYCRWLQQANFEKTVYPSQIVHYRIK